MKKYRVTTKFVTMYTKEEEIKIEYTDNFRAALGAYVTYIENPETVFCTIDIIGKNKECKKIIALFQVEQAKAYSFFIIMLIRTPGQTNTLIFNTKR